LRIVIKFINLYIIKFIISTLSLFLQIENCENWSS